MPRNKLYSDLTDYPEMVVPGSGDRNRVPGHSRPSFFHGISTSVIRFLQVHRGKYHIGDHQRAPSSTGLNGVRKLSGIMTPGRSIGMSICQVGFCVLSQFLLNNKLLS